MREILRRVVAQFVVDRRVLALAFARMADGIGNSFLIIVIPLYVASDVVGGATFGLEEAMIIGIVLSLFGFLNSSFQPFTGRLSDRIGRRKPFILLGLGGLAATNLAYLFAESYVSLVVIRGLQGECRVHRPGVDRARERTRDDGRPGKHGRLQHVSAGRLRGRSGRGRGRRQPRPILDPRPDRRPVLASGPDGERVRGRLRHRCDHGGDQLPARDRPHRRSRGNGGERRRRPLDRDPRSVGQPPARSDLHAGRRVAVYGRLDRLARDDSAAGERPPGAGIDLVRPPVRRVHRRPDPVADADRAGL